MMSPMTEWDESDVTRWAEDDTPEAHQGGTAPEELSDQPEEASRA